MTDSSRRSSYQPQYRPPGYSAHGYPTDGNATDVSENGRYHQQGTPPTHSSPQGSIYYPDDVVRNSRADPSTCGSSGAASAYRNAVHGQKPPDDSRPTTAASHDLYQKWTLKPGTDLSDEPGNRPQLPPRPGASSTNTSTPPVVKRKDSRSGWQAIGKGVVTVLEGALKSLS